MAPVVESIRLLDSEANCTSSPPRAASNASSCVIRLLPGEANGGAAMSAELKPRRTRRVGVPEHDLVRRVHKLDVGTRRKMVASLAGVADELDR